MLYFAFNFLPFSRSPSRGPAIHVFLVDITGNNLLSNLGEIWTFNIQIYKTALASLACEYNFLPTLHFSSDISRERVHPKFHSGTGLAWPHRFFFLFFFFFRQFDGFFFYTRSTICKEKLEGLWTGWNWSTTALIGRSSSFFGASIYEWICYCAWNIFCPR